MALPALRFRAKALAAALRALRQQRVVYMASHTDIFSSSLLVHSPVGSYGNAVKFSMQLPVDANYMELNFYLNMALLRHLYRVIIKMDVIIMIFLS